MLGIIYVAVYVFSQTTGMASGLALFVPLGGSALGSLLAYSLCVSALDWVCLRKKLVFIAEFDDVLPKEAWEKARAVKDHFDNLYLIIDQQNRWKSALLPDPRPRALDPLLIGEHKEGHRRKFFVIDQFDLTEAEQYLTDEFAAK
jgi:hypothetical protein